MAQKPRLEFTREGISCKVDKDLAILRLTCDAFATLTNVHEDRVILEWFDLIESLPEIKGVLTLNDENCFGEVAYNKFLSDTAGKKIDLHHPEVIDKFKKSHIRAIEINMLMSFIRKIVGFRKLFLVGLRGDVVTPFFGLSLAADMRFASEGTRFLLSHIKYSIHPSGALPFFLPRYIGQSKAMEFLLRGGTISDKEALNLNLVNKIYAVENFEERCIKEAREILELSPSYIKVTKTLTNTYMKELEAYFDLESHYLQN